jgi:uncharacterized protein (TIGR00156 family)
MLKIIPLLLLFAAAPALAQFDPAVKADVKSILAAPDDGQRVILRGTITGKVGEEQYMFTDGTGHIQLDVEDRLLWGQILSEGTRVEVEGKVNEHWFSDVIDIDVERVLVLKGKADAGSSGSNG